MIVLALTMMVWGGEFPYGHEGAQAPVLLHALTAISLYTPEALARFPDVDLDNLQGYYRGQYGLATIGRTNPAFHERLSQHQWERDVNNMNRTLQHIRAEMGRRAALRKQQTLVALHTRTLV